MPSPSPSPSPIDPPGRVVVRPSGGDDLGNLQAAVNSLTNGGDVVLVPTASVTGRVINVKAIGTALLRPLSGPPTNGLIRIEDDWGYKIEGLDLHSSRTGVGKWLGRETGVGTNGGQAIIERVNVSSFSSGFRLGTSTRTATSELIFFQCKAASCDIGMELLDYNTLDVLLNMWAMDACRVGISTSTAGDVHVVGGSASNNKIDFNLKTGGTFSVNKYRSEGTTQFLYSGATTARTNILLESCEVVGITDPTNTPVVRAGWGDALTIISCYLSGFVGWNQVYGPTLLPSTGTLTMIGTYLQDGSVAAPPQPFRGNAPDATNLPYRVFGCSWRGAGKGQGAPDGWFPDQTGVVKGGKLVPTWQADASGNFNLGNRAVVNGSWTDGSAGRNMAKALAQAGLIVDMTS